VIASLAPGASQGLALFAKLAAPGFHSVTASIPKDRLQADDVRQWVVRGIHELRVLMVNGGPGSDPRDDDTFFLNHALAPVDQRHRPDYFIKRTVISPADLPSARLNDFDVIMLANVPELAGQTTRDLQAFVRRGGGLMVFPGATINTAFYNEQLTGTLKLLPATFQSVQGDATRDDQFVTMQDRDYGHPVVSIWSDSASGTLSSARFFQHYTLAPQSNGSPQTVVTYSDGSPAVVEWGFGLGRVFQFSSTANTAWNDWPVRPSFVPFIHRTLGALAQRRDDGLNIAVGEPFVRRMATEFLGKEAIIRAPGHVDAAAQDRRVELLDDFPTIRVDDIDRAGIYSVQIADPPLAEKFAAHANSAESSLEQLSANQLELLAQVADVTPWSPDLSFTGRMEHGGSEFWTPLVLVAIAVALAEGLLGQWFSRST
jgi:hypothetical protein